MAPAMATDDDEPDEIDHFKRAMSLWARAIEQAAEEEIPYHIQMVALGMAVPRPALPRMMPRGRCG